MKHAIRKVAHLAGLDIRRARGGPVWHFDLDYPLDSKPRWGYGQPPHPAISKLLESGLPDYAGLLDAFQRFDGYFSAIAYDAASPIEPNWNNTWFSTLDAAALSAFLMLRAPKRYIEIGSGTSTKFARHAIRTNGLATEIISIDPHPRAGIDGLCDRVIRQGLETVDPELFDTLGDDDILFFDGSHRTFENSDVTAFFFDVLPRVKPGILVHIHDIFWPDDYPPQWSGRFYSEQYLLGAMMLGGDKVRVVLPNYFVSRHPQTAPLIAKLSIPPMYPSLGLPGVSFWLETR